MTLWLGKNLNVSVGKVSTSPFFFKQPGKGNKMTCTEPQRTGCATNKARRRKRKSYKYYVRQEKRLAKILRSRVRTYERLSESEIAAGEGAPSLKRCQSASNRDPLSASNIDPFALSWPGAA